MADISDVYNHLTGMMHAGSALGKVRNPYYALERASNNLRANIKTLDLQREAPLSTLIYDDYYSNPLPSDFDSMIDLKPSGIRQYNDQARRQFVTPFDLQKAIKQKTLSIEGREGNKMLMVNWRGIPPILLDAMNEVGDWVASGSTTGLKFQRLYKISGDGSLEFTVPTTGGGIQNTALDTLDLTDEDEIADLFVWVHIPTATALARITSMSALWGNDLTTNYWSRTGITEQGDGTEFKVGWNLVKFTWADATETGTVDPETIDSFRISFVTSGGTVQKLRVDNPVFVVGRNFDLSYYSLYAFRNSAGTYIIRPTDDSDEVLYTGTAWQIFLEEARKECAAQIEGEDSAFDINYATKRLWGDAASPDPMGRIGLYAKYRKEFPSQSKSAVGSWANPRNPNFFRK